MASWNPCPSTDESLIPQWPGGGGDPRESGGNECCENKVRQVRAQVEVHRKTCFRSGEAWKRVLLEQTPECSERSQRTMLKKHLQAEGAASAEAPGSIPDTSEEE